MYKRINSIIFFANLSKGKEDEELPEVSCHIWQEETGGFESDPGMSLKED
jgi:hypothetical protein